MDGQIHLGEIFEQLARLRARVDARQGVARAVRVAAQELARRKVLPRVLLQTRRVLALAISASLNAPIPDAKFGVFRM